MRQLQYADLGLIPYPDCLAIQQKLVKLRLAGKIEDTLLLLEHEPVMTVGTAGGDANLLVEPERLQQLGVMLVHTDRGGNITYHGPGQLVGYPILDLRSHGKDVHLYLRNLERVVADCLGEFGVRASVVPGFTGVWVGEEKICSIGIAARRWITYHGFALNVNPNLEHWALIHPCGLVGKRVTSLEKILGRDPGMDAVKASVVRRFGEVFDLSTHEMTRSEILRIADEEPGNPTA